MGHPYHLVQPDSILLPEEIYYMNFKYHHAEQHCHPPGSLEFNYVADGTCYYEMEDQIYSLKKRNLILVNGSVSHQMQSDHPFILMSINCFPHSCDSNGSLSPLSALTAACPQLQTLFENLTQALVLPDAHEIYPTLQAVAREQDAEKDPYYLNLLIQKALIEIVRNQSAARPTPAQQYVEQIKNYIRYHYFSIKTIDEIAGFVSLNKAYLQKIFKQETGITLWQYLTQYRLEKAAYLLQNSNTPIGDLDQMVGIHSRQNFYLLFKRYYKQSPSDYRKNHKQNNPLISQPFP